MEFIFMMTGISMLFLSVGFIVHVSRTDDQRETNLMREFGFRPKEKTTTPAETPEPK